MKHPLIRHTMLVLTLCLSGAVAADNCRLTKTIEKRFDADPFTEVELRALAGELEVTASADDQIHFWGRVCTDSQANLDMMDLDILTSDGKLTLIAIIPYHQENFDPWYATMDIEFSLPANLNLRLRDSSGDIHVSDVSVLSIEDSSGDIKVSNARTDLTIRDSSGRIGVRGVAGKINVTDSSGDIDIREISGDVEIPGDSSGDIEISGVSGAVVIDRDSSGDIDIDDVELDVTIGRDGAGDIKIESVRGAVSIHSDGSGSVTIDDVGGDLVIRNKGAGDIRTHGISGSIDTPG